MLKNYLKIALRNLHRQKVHSAINVAGLAVGIACCLVILLFIHDELRYDAHHTHADRIYRVAREWVDEDGTPTLRLARISAPIAPALAEAFPEVEHAARIWGNGGLIGRGDEYFDEPRFYFAEPDLFEILTITMIKGDPSKALAEPFTVVITRAMAQKYFGDDDPLGQTLRLDNEYDLRVTGIAENAPAATHFHYDFLASFATLEAVFGDNAFTNWRGNNSYATYVRLTEGKDPAALESRFTTFVNTRYNTEGLSSRLFLQPVRAIHLHSHLDTEFEPNGDIAYVYLFSAVALFILLIACFNFMSLSTAQATQRAREIGVRKVLGAARRQLAGQFLGEALLLTLCALLLAGLLAQAMLPVFNDLAGKDLRLLGNDAALVLSGLVGLALLAGLLAGSYPALYLSALRPAGALKGGRQTGDGGAGLRSVLVVAQFAISIVLLTGTGVVYRQVQYVQQKQLGFDQEHLVVLPGTSAIIDRFADVRAQLTAYPGVRAVTASRLVPSDQLLDHIGGTAEVKGAVRRFEGLPLLPVDHDFVGTFGIELAAGRTFSKERASDSTEAFVLNESAVRMLGWSSPEAAIGQRLTLEGNSFTRPGYVIGVVEDFHFESMHERIAPLVMLVFPERHRLVTVRIAGRDIDATMAFLQNKWAEYRPNYPFTYRLIAEDVLALYQSERRLGEVAGCFALLAVLIACLGLFGLAAHTAARRTKEIGVRKVLGATVLGLAGLLSRDFMKLMGLAFVVAAPVAYGLASWWLGAFAYRVDLGPGVFVLAGALTLVIALLTVSYHAVRTALADPVKSLRYE